MTTSHCRAPRISPLRQYGARWCREPGRFPGYRVLRRHRQVRCLPAIRHDWDHRCGGNGDRDVRRCHVDPQRQCPRIGLRRHRSALRQRLRSSGVAVRVGCGSCGDFHNTDPLIVDHEHDDHYADRSITTRFFLSLPPDLTSIWGDTGVNVAAGASVSIHCLWHRALHRHSTGLLLHPSGLSVGRDDCRAVWLYLP